MGDDPPVVATFAADAVGADRSTFPTVRPADGFRCGYFVVWRGTSMHYRECLGCGARYLMGSAGGDCPKCGGALQNISLSRE